MLSFIRAKEVGVCLVPHLLSVLLTGGSHGYDHDLRGGEPERPGTKHLDYSREASGALIRS